MDHEFDLGFDGSRGQRATPGQQTELRAVAEGGDALSVTIDIGGAAAPWGQPRRVTRDQLSENGLLFAIRSGPDRLHGSGLGAVRALSARLIWQGHHGHSLGARWVPSAHRGRFAGAAAGMPNCVDATDV